MYVLPLTDPLASDAAVTGAKAANLARCAAAGLPTLPGSVLTTSATARGVDDPAVVAELRAAWHDLTASGTPLVVRSSSTIEDAGSSSMAGRFTSVLDVTTWDDVLDATRRVIASAETVRDAEGGVRPIAVLIQPQLETSLGGVMFGVDPVTGDRDHVVVEAVAARPDVLVGGTAVADHHVLTRRGRVVSHTSVRDAVPLPRALRRALVRMAADAARVFGSPQDVEWAVGRDGRVRLLQSRPVTAVATPTRDTTVVTMGPGPVAETFPDPLSPLEIDLWVEPMRTGTVRALRATGAVGERAIARSPVVTTIDGRVAVDLGLLGADVPGWHRRVSPRVIARRLGAAWRVGRLRVALPRLVTTVVDAVDTDLADLGDPRSRTSAELVDLLRRASAELATVHAYEMLSGMLWRRGDLAAEGGSAALLALRRLESLRHAGVEDDVVAVSLAPEVLALVPPSITRPPRLPATGTQVVTTAAVPGASGTVDDLSARDALRLRARWLQELQARLALECGRRLADTGRVPPPMDATAVGLLRFDELDAAMSGHPIPTDLAERAARALVPSAPLPVCCRIAVDGRRPVVIPATMGEARTHRGRRRATPASPATLTGLPAGSGRATGTVVHDRLPVDATGPVVLVTEHLGPDLAVVLPQLAALVSETGSALSHVAILARELGLPTVAGAAGARRVLAPGSEVAVDGGSGTVTVIAPAPPLDGAHDDRTPASTPTDEAAHTERSVSA